MYKGFDNIPAGLDRKFDNDGLSSFVCDCGETVIVHELDQQAYCLRCGIQALHHNEDPDEGSFDPISLQDDDFEGNLFGLYDDDDYDLDEAIETPLEPLPEFVIERHLQMEHELVNTLFGEDLDNV